MEEVIGRCVRAPESYLALRLPFKGSGLAAEPEDLPPEMPVVEREKDAGRKGVKYVKKASKTDVGKVDGVNAGADKAAQSSEGTTTGASIPGQPPLRIENGKDAHDAAADGANGRVDDKDTTETGRPRRAVRKSVRISEG